MAASMDNCKQNIIREIAQELDCGCDCYYNTKTDAIIGIPNCSQFGDDEAFIESFQEVFEQIEKQQSDFIKFEALESYESFQIMELFVAQISDVDFKIKMERILNNKKPFQNFKNSIDNSNFKQDWFHFKTLQLEKRVEVLLNLAKERD